MQTAAVKSWHDAARSTTSIPTSAEAGQCSPPHWTPRGAGIQLVGWQHGVLQWRRTPGAPVCEPGGPRVTGVCVRSTHISQEGCESRRASTVRRGVSAGGPCGLWGGGVRVTVRAVGLELWRISYAGYFEISRCLLTFHRYLMLWFVILVMLLFNV